MRIQICRGLSIEIDSSYSTEVRNKDRFEVVAYKRWGQGEIIETVLYRSILECDALNFQVFLERILK